MTTDLTELRALRDQVAGLTGPIQGYNEWIGFANIPPFKGREQDLLRQALRGSINAAVALIERMNDQPIDVILNEALELLTHQWGVRPDEAFVSQYARAILYVGIEVPRDD